MPQSNVQRVILNIPITGKNIPILDLRTFGVWHLPVSEVSSLDERGHVWTILGSAYAMIVVNNQNDV